MNENIIYFISVIHFKPKCQFQMFSVVKVLKLVKLKMNKKQAQ